MRATVLAWMAAAFLASGGESRAQDAIDTAYRAALAGSPTPGALERGQAEWLEVRRADDTFADQEEISRLNAITAHNTAARAARPTLAQLITTCTAAGDNPCDAEQGGFLSDLDGHVLYWQIQSSSDDRGIFSAFVLLVPEGDRLRPVAWSRDAATFRAPILIADEDSWYVAISGIADGSAGGNRDSVFRWTPAAGDPLTEIDSWSWRDTLPDRLPEGLEIRRGVIWNWDEMLALTPLWRDDDGDCCGAGGSAVLSFAFEQDRLVLAEASIRDSAASVVSNTPVEVLDYVRRAQFCARWAGAGDDPGISQAIGDDLLAARCDALDVDAEALGRAHGRNRAVMELIARARTMRAS